MEEVSCIGEHLGFLDERGTREVSPHAYKEAQEKYPQG